MACSAYAASRTVRAIVPTESIRSDIGTTMSRDVIPTVGLIPTTPLLCAGHTTDPSVSVPNAANARPKSTATALPPELPQGS